MKPLIEVRGLRKVYTRTHWRQKRLQFLALDDVAHLVAFAVYDMHAIAEIGVFVVEGRHLVGNDIVDPRARRYRQWIGWGNPLRP